MSVIRTYQANGAVTASSGFNKTSDGTGWIFSEGSWSWNPDVYTYAGPGTGTIEITVDATVSVWDLTNAIGAENPPVLVSTSTLQVLIDGGATFVSAPTASADDQGGQVSYLGGSGHVFAESLAALAYTFTGTRVMGFPAVGSNGFLATLGFQLDVPDSPSLIVEGEGGVAVIDEDGAVIVTSGFPVDELIVVGSGGIVVGGDETPIVLSADVSGIYTLVKNKTDDTLYNRRGFSVFVGTEDVKIPDPFIKTAFIGG